MRKLMLLLAIVMASSFANASSGFDNFGEFNCHLIEDRGGKREDFRIILTKTKIDIADSKEVYSLTRIDKDGSISQNLYGADKKYLTTTKVDEMVKKAFDESKKIGGIGGVQEPFKNYDPFINVRRVSLYSSMLAADADYKANQLKMAEIKKTFSFSYDQSTPDEMEMREYVDYDFVHSVGVTLSEDEKLGISYNLSSGSCARVK